MEYLSGWNLDGATKIFKAQSSGSFYLFSSKQKGKKMESKKILSFSSNLFEFNEDIDRV